MPALLVAMWRRRNERLGATLNNQIKEPSYILCPVGAGGGSAEVLVECNSPGEVVTLAHSSAP